MSIDEGGRYAGSASAGSTGSIGSTGSTGSIGSTGSNGSTGSIGSVGSAGSIGSVGSAGSIGSIGSVDGSPATGVGSPVAVALAALRSAVEALAVASDPSTPAGRLEGEAAAEVVREALAVAGRLSAIAARMVPVVEADGWWTLDGARSITTWLA
ncbi:hypothetical protein, partial [Cellulomonas sp. P5_E12]